MYLSPLTGRRPWYTTKSSTDPVQEKNMKIEIISFTEQGQELAGRLAGQLGAAAVRCGKEHPLHAWTREAFANADALIYVGALGICVRSVAPYVRSKSTDPAVVVIDETAKYVIPVLGGHLGGANDLARRIAGIIGAEPVITTATDRRNVFSVDAWARLQGCAVENPGKIKTVSVKLLKGEEICIRSDYPIRGEAPERVKVLYGTLKDPAGGNVRTKYVQAAGEEAGVVSSGCHGEADVCVSIYRTDSSLLHIVPKIVCAGIGTKRGIHEQQVGEAVEKAFAKAGISECALAGVFSIDLKKDEEGLAAFCRKRAVPFITYTAEELRKAEGSFSASRFVEEITGVDNVCERSAVLGAAWSDGRPPGDERWIRKAEIPADNGTKLIFGKHAYDGVTVAFAVRDFNPDFRWTGEEM